MPPRIRVKSDDATIKARRVAAAGHVIKQFGEQLPDSRLLCFLDDEDFPDLKELAGDTVRGFYTVIGSGEIDLGRVVPAYVIDCVFSETESKFVFDHLIYLHGSTCMSDVGLTLTLATLAHELQHFIQHSNILTLWTANHFIRPFALKFLELKPFEIPIEQEARIVSKQTAENLLGTEAVRQFIYARIAEPINTNDDADWRSILDLVSSRRYDLAHETKLIFQRLKSYRPKIAELLQEVKMKPDFKDIDLDALFDGEGS